MVKMLRAHNKVAEVNLINYFKAGCLFIGAAICLFAQPINAQGSYKVAIIIDDLGNNLRQGQELINLPYQLTYSFLPMRPYSKRLANLAATSGKEVMVHLPMQSATHANLGDGALTLELTQNQFQQSVRTSLDSVPHAKGVNNHMGSLLTQHPGHMSWLMEVLSAHQETLYFVDSKTTAMTIAGQIADEHLVPHISRDVFIDDSKEEKDIRKQLAYLIEVAKRKGYAVAIGHPYPQTVKLLSEYLPTLANQNIEVVSVTRLLKTRETSQQWTTLSFGDQSENLN